jgi:hypothetical protein
MLFANKATKSILGRDRDLLLHRPCTDVRPKPSLVHFAISVFIWCPSSSPTALP